MLTLPIKKKWFDMILSGEKKEEYRAKNKYYDSRFWRYEDEEIDVIFRNGYSNNSPQIQCKVIPNSRFGGKPEWGAENDMYWVLTVMKIKLLSDKLSI